MTTMQPARPKNPHDHTAVTFRPDVFYLLFESARANAGHRLIDVTAETGVGLDTLRRLGEGAEIRLPNYLSLAAYIRKYVQLDDEQTRWLPGTTGELYPMPARPVDEDDQDPVPA
jgi:hypothetical protein